MSDFNTSSIQRHRVPLLSISLPPTVLSLKQTLDLPDPLKLLTEQAEALQGGMATLAKLYIIFIF